MNIFEFPLWSKTAIKKLIKIVMLYAVALIGSYGCYYGDFFSLG